MKKVFYKCKQNTNNISIAKKQSKKIKTNAKLPEKILKPTKLYLLRNNNLAIRVRYKKVKQIFKKELIFDFLSFELCTILQALQKTDYFI